MTRKTISATEVIKGPWGIKKKMTIKERELLFILAESAGLEVYPDTRLHMNMSAFPYVIWEPHSKDVYVDGQELLKTYLYTLMRI